MSDLSKSFLQKHKIKRIAISRTDAIGDVILTIPLCGYLKKLYPTIQIDFIAKDYTKSILTKSRNIDRVILKDQIDDYFKNTKPDVIIMVFPDKLISGLAKDYKIPFRIGTSHRWWHWLHLNYRVDFSRKNSDLHEAQLNFELLKGIGIDYLPKLTEIPSFYGFDTIEISKSAKIRLIFHPKSRGSARDWPLKNYKKLASLLDPDKYIISITGTEAEKEIILSEDPDFFSNNCMENHLGKYSLEELIEFISKSDGLIACSTGPLHIAAALEKFALGLYPPIRPMHPGRWAPLGKNALAVTGKEQCFNCPVPANCECMSAIQSEMIANSITSHFNSRDLY